MNSFGWGVTQYDSCPCKKRSGHRHMQRRGDVKTQGKGSHLQAKGRGLEEVSLANTSSQVSRLLRPEHTHFCCGSHQSVVLGCGSPSKLTQVSYQTLRLGPRYCLKLAGCKSWERLPPVSFWGKRFRILSDSEIAFHGAGAWQWGIPFLFTISLWKRSSMLPLSMITWNVSSPLAKLLNWLKVRTELWQEEKMGFFLLTLGQRNLGKLSLRHFGFPGATWTLQL